MKRIYLMVFFITVGLLANAQRRTIDSLRGVLSRPEADTEKIHTLILLCGSYYIPNPDSAIIFGQQAYDLAVKYNKKKQEIRAINNMANAYSSLGDYPKSMQFYYRAKSAYEEMNDVTGITTENNNIGATYIQEADYKNGLAVLQLANRQWYAYTRSHKLVTILQKQEQTNLDINIAECFLFSHRIDSAVHYLQLTIIENRKIAYDGVLENIERDFGEVEIERRDKPVALQHLRLAAVESVAAEDVEMLSMTYLSSAKLYHEFSERDSAEFYAKKAFEVAAASGYEQDVLNAGKLLYTYYDEDHNLPEAYKYFKLTTAAKDSLYSQDRLRQLLSLDFDEKQRRQDIAAAREQYRDEVRTWLFIAGSIVLSLLVFVFWRSSLQRKSANQLLKTQKEDIESALSKLQSTQVQLIQSEKMASLGELTAGIAHEIQNPLNFVNNFSEVNSEMIDELKAELQIGNIEDALILADEIQQNEDKISHHGKRADAIVKGMLQHSRANSNVKEPTNINKVADEYLRLAYHGLRAKDKIFNAELETHFADNLPDINVVPQDIGRVLLNLFTNAFYATQQKQKLDLPGYKPTVSVATVAQNNEVVITVKDNGNGIPDGIKDKIMQPFFTTKPTGQGTGLGLSLSYDIVVKGHGGRIDVKSEEGNYTEFIIAIPV